MTLRLVMLLMIAVGVVGAGAGAASDPAVAVRHHEGLIHGFLTLKTLSGTLLASGDLTQHVNGDRVTARLTYRFKDGSTHDETTIFTQRNTFRLVSDHLVQKGPAFAQPLDMTIETSSGVVTVRYTDEDGKAKLESERFDLPANLSNGMVPIVLKNIAPGGAIPTLSYIAATPKPRLVKLVVSPAGTDRFSTASIARRATHYVLEVEIGGLAGLVAPILGKEPPDIHVWLLGGDTPAFVKSEGPLFNGGAPWRTELTSPVWP